MKTVDRQFAAVISDSSGIDFVPQMRCKVPVILVTGSTEKHAKRSLGFVPSAIVNKSNHRWSEEIAELLEVTDEEFHWRDTLIEAYRNCWLQHAQRNRPFRVALAISHGYLERIARRATVRITDPVREFLNRQLQFGDCDSVNIENEAAELGLPVCDPEERVLEINANFGVVDSVDDREARVILLDGNDQHLLDDFVAPLNWLPLAYRDSGTGVAWIERVYDSGVKGRFEPASALNQHEQSIDSTIARRAK
ncbi:MAG: hypothetical protein O3A00_02700 [Planctomycetota bacterium]|nr:hypothetical protein [Planctomycetota bacterium]